MYLSDVISKLFQYSVTIGTVVLFAYVVLLVTDAFVSYKLQKMRKEVEMRNRRRVSGSDFLGHTVTHDSSTDGPDKVRNQEESTDS